MSPSSYIIVVNPAILKAADIPVDSSMMATLVTSIVGTLLMGLYASRPFAIAPYMGENAFIAFTVVQVLPYTWQSALAAVYLAGILFFLLTLCGLRHGLVDAVPPALRYSFAVGIGLFLTFVGLKETGIVMLGNAGAPPHTGHLTAKPVLLAISGFSLHGRPDDPSISRRHSCARILVTALIAFASGVAAPPDHWLSLPPSLAPLLFKLSFKDAF